jgi:hypothetical protein
MTRFSTKNPEKGIQAQILAWLEVVPDLKAVRVPVGPMLVGNKPGRKAVWTSSPIKGFPDIMGWLADGKPFYIEVKSPTGRLRPEQKDWRVFLSDKPGCIYILARSVHDVIEGLKEHRGNL